MQEGTGWTTGAGVIGLDQSALLVRRGAKLRPKETPARACWLEKETESASLRGAGPVFTVGTKVQIRGCMYYACT